MKEIRYWREIPNLLAMSQPHGLLVFYPHEVSTIETVYRNHQEEKLYDMCLMTLENRKEYWVKRDDIMAIMSGKKD